jgi:hypothetical protein
MLADYQLVIANGALCRSYTHGSRCFLNWEKELFEVVRNHEAAED